MKRVLKPLKGAWSLKGKTFSPMMHYFHVTGLVADKSFEKKHGTPKGKYISRTHPSQIKERKISSLISSIKFELINFLKGFFEGEFLKIVDEKGKMVPSIGLFSLNYPTDEKKIIEWLRIQNGFFQCFSTSTYDPFRNDNYLLFEEEGREYNNYLIFSNRKDIDTSLFDDVDSSIKNLIKYCTLQIFALYRWAEIQEKLIGKLNTLTTKEILNLKKEDLNTLLAIEKICIKKCLFLNDLKLNLKHIMFHLLNVNLFPLKTE